MLKPGSRWKSNVCTAEAVVVRAPKNEGLPQCGGIDMSPMGESGSPATPVSGFDGGCTIGKRYKSDADGLEMLCTKAGKGALGFAGTILTPVETKKLPASD
jgi:hypothetical protein